MPPIFTDEQISSMPPAEQAVARDVNAAEAAGRDPMADPDDSAPAAEAPAPSPAPAPAPTDAAAEVPPKEAAPEGEAAPAEGAAAAPAPAEPEAKAEEAPGEPEPYVPRLQGKQVENYGEQKKAIRTEKSTARAKWSAGEIDDTEYARLESEADDKLEALQEQHITARALDQAGEQLRIQQENLVLNAIATRAKGEGIDYGDQQTAGRYDRALALVNGDPSFKDKSFTERAEEAHRTVLAMSGKGSTAPTTAPTPAAAPAAAAPRVAPPAPKTLAALPTAAVPNTGDTARDRLAGLKGREAEKFWNSLPASKQAEILGEAA